VYILLSGESRSFSVPRLQYQEPGLRLLTYSGRAIKLPWSGRIIYKLLAHNLTIHGKLLNILQNGTKEMIICP